MRIKFFYRFHGRVNVRLDSPFQEKFVNSCFANKISLRNISVFDNSLFFTLSAVDFIRARKLRLFKGCRVRILSKEGFVRHFLPLVCLPFLFLGGVFCLIFLMFTTRFVWDVVIDSEGIDNRSLAISLEDIGLRPGILKSSVDNEKIKNLMLLENDDLGWLAVNVSGCRAKVSYSLKRRTPELIAKTTPCDVIADRIAVIRQVDTYEGTCLVAPGTTVFPGDIIISSEIIIPDRYTNSQSVRYVHAGGDVWGRTWYDLTAHSSSRAAVKTYSEKNKRKVYLYSRKKGVILPWGYGNPGDKCFLVVDCMGK